MSSPILTSEPGHSGHCEPVHLNASPTLSLLFIFLPSFGFLFSCFPFSSLPHAHLSCVTAKFLKVSLLQDARSPQTSTVLLGQQAFACNCFFWKMLKAETKGWGANSTRSGYPSLHAHSGINNEELTAPQIWFLPSGSLACLLQPWHCTMSIKNWWHTWCILDGEKNPVK